MDACDAKTHSAERIFHCLVSGLGFCVCGIVSVIHTKLGVEIGEKCTRMAWWRRGNPEQGGGASAEYRQPLQQQSGTEAKSEVPSLAAITKALLFTRRRLWVSDKKHIHFLYEPGKQVSSAIKVKNTSSCFVAFKFQTNSPKSCFMRPPSGILTPGETVVASVVKFVEPPEQNRAKKNKEKFRIVSLKVKQGLEFTPELFEERKEFVAVEQVLEVVFLDPHSRSPEIAKLKKRLAEAKAAQQACKKPLEDKDQKTVAAGGVLDDWKEQGEKQLVVQQIEGT